MNKETLNQYLIVAIIYLSIFAFVFSFDDIASIVFAQTTEELPIEVVEPLPELSSDSILKVAIDSIIASSTALTTEAVSYTHLTLPTNREV